MTKITKRWETKAKLLAVVMEGEGTRCYVGVDHTDSLWMQRRTGALTQRPDIRTVIGELAFAGMLSDSGLTDAERHLWWFGFEPGEDKRLADIQLMAEALARVLQA